MSGVTFEEDPSVSLDEFVNWYCWRIATSGERFYPPDETAEECIAHFEAEQEESEAINVTDISRGQEYGEHARAWTNAVEFFSDMAKHGFDPVARAEKYVESTQDGDCPELDGIDWEWLAESHYTNYVEEN